MGKREFLVGEAASIYPDLYHPDSELAAFMREREGVAVMPHWPGESRLVNFEDLLEQAVNWMATRMSELKFLDGDLRACLRSESEIVYRAALRSSVTGTDLLTELVAENGNDWAAFGGDIDDVLHNPNLNEVILRDVALACVREEQLEELERATHHSNWNPDHNDTVRLAIREQGQTPEWETWYQSAVPRN
jgi:hypothetical protein